MSEFKRNPKDSMNSTWRADRSVWNLAHWQYELLALHSSNLGQEVPVHNKTDKIPFLPNWQHQRWVLFHAFIPLVLQQLYIWGFKHNMHPLVAFIFYVVSLKAIAIKELHMLRRLGHQYGFLDGDVHPRDEVPDHAVSTVLRSLISTAVARPLFSVFLAYRTSKTPMSMNWLMLPLEIGIYGIVLDFWFYWYHRLMHQNDSLWKYHRTHHLTKHPNPLLTLYADHEQEFFDIAGVPLMAYVTMKLCGFPMGFYEWWICQQFIVYTELFGHSGLRLYSTPPSPLHWLLKLVKSDLVVEDHDLHHRSGWKKSHNYGKQTRLWDRVFGTCAERIESTPENIDFENRVSLPLW